MTTKAQLQQQVKDLEFKLEVAEGEKNLAKLDTQEAEAAADHAEHKLERMAPLTFWPCPNSAGQPFCVSTDNDDPNGFSVNLYVIGESIVGVEVYSKVTAIRRAAAGLVPVEA
jgi:hypothetical protein